MDEVWNDVLDVSREPDLASRYVEDDLFYGYRKILCYGIAFFRKDARVKIMA